MKHALCLGALVALTLHSAVNLEARTATQLTSDARILARDPSATGRPRFSDAQILDLLNEAQRDAIADTLCILKSYSFDTAVNTTYYAMPSDYIAVNRLLSDDQKLDEKSPAKLDLASKEWETQEGEVQNFFVHFASRTKLGFYPVPDVAGDTTTIRVDYYAQATDMEAGGTPFNSITEFKPFHAMLAFYAAAYMLYIDGMAAGDRYMARYLTDKAKMQGYCVNRPTYSPNVNIMPK